MIGVQPHIDVAGASEPERLGGAEGRGVLIVMPVTFPEFAGGAERQCSILAPALSRLGWRVEVLSPSLNKSLPQSEDLGGYRIHRICTRALPSLGGRYAPSAISWTRQAYRWIKERKADFDVIYTFHARLHAAPAALAAKSLGLPHAIKLGRGGDTFDFKSLHAKRFIYGSLLCDLMRRSTSVFIANSTEIVSDLQAHGVASDRIKHIPNGVALGETIARSVGEGCDFLYTGRLSSEKRLDVLIRAFASIAALHPKARLLIAGAGDDEARLRAVISESSALDQIQMLGRLDDLSAVYANATFFVSASDAEGQSNALLEAMSFSLPPIVCQASGTEDLIADGRNGVVMPRSDEESVRAALLRALEISPEARTLMGSRARERVEVYCGIDAVAAATSQALLQIIEAPIPNARSDRRIIA